MPLNEVLAKRRSHREFAATELTDEQVSQLCWAAQGISAAGGYRTAPSAGALYPITIIVGDRHGIREYLPQSHSLKTRGKTDVRKKLQAAALNQECVATAPACFIIAYDVGRTAAKYGKRAEQYCLIETGHVAQNLLLTATSLGLAAVPIGAFHAERATEILGLPRRLKAVYLIPVGHAK
jgi:SagB-type dehydrogenase family enzyme